MNKNKNWKYQSQIPDDSRSWDSVWAHQDTTFNKIIRIPGNKPILMFKRYIDDDYIDYTPDILEKIKNEGIRIVNYYFNGPEHLNVTFFKEEDAVAIKMMVL